MSTREVQVRMSDKPRVTECLSDWVREREGEREVVETRDVQVEENVEMKQGRD